MIEMVKTSRLLRTIGTTDITNRVILQALHRLNEECTSRLGAMEGVEMLRSCDMGQTRYSRKIFSECVGLSFQGPNQVFPALVLQDRKNIPTLTSQQLDMTLYVCASFLDLTQTKTGPCAKKAMKQLVEGVRGMNLRSRY